MSDSVSHDMHGIVGTARALIDTLGLQRHPEGGWYREYHRSPAAPGERSAMTSIYFLLCRGERSHWHRMHTSEEIWHHHAGAPLELLMASDAADPDAIERVVLGPDVIGGQHPQALVAADRWQTARSLGDWTLCGCTVAPGFLFTDFELAPPGWVPGHPISRMPSAP